MSEIIIIVEDNELSMKLHADILEVSGYTVIQSRNGDDVIGLAEEFQPDLILMNIKLQEASGLTYVEMLKADENLKHIPIVAISSFITPGTEEKILRSGCVACIPNSVFQKDVLYTIECCLHKQGRSLESLR